MKLNWLFGSKNKDRSSCPHFSHGVLIQADCCKTWYPCHRCHNDAKDQEEAKNPTRGALGGQSLVGDEAEKVCAHTLMSTEITRIKCGSCDTEQAEVATNKCSNCKLTFGGSHWCEKCNIWQNKSNSVFHCSECGCCRLGRQQDFKHCPTCRSCWPVGVPHQCFENRLQDVCFMCLENLNDCMEPVVASNKCRHAFHRKCFRELIEFSKKKGGNIVQCPLCNTQLLFVM